MCKFPLSKPAARCRFLFLLGVVLSYVNVSHVNSCNLTAVNGDCPCNWSWGGESRGFATRGLQPKSVSDGHGGKMIGIVAATDISRGAPILKVPIACVILQQADTQRLVESVLSKSEDSQVKPRSVWAIPFSVHIGR
jgi:hypothetical protein